MAAVFPKPVLISPEAVDFLTYEIFIRARKLFFTLYHKLRIVIISDMFIRILLEILFSTNKDANIKC
jgi:hypothetical protein